MGLGVVPVGRWPTRGACALWRWCGPGPGAGAHRGLRL